MLYIPLVLMATMVGCDRYEVDQFGAYARSGGQLQLLKGWAWDSVDGHIKDFDGTVVDQTSSVREIVIFGPHDCERTRLYKVNKFHVDNGRYWFDLNCFWEGCSDVEREPIDMTYAPVDGKPNMCKYAPTSPLSSGSTFVLRHHLRGDQTYAIFGTT